VALVDLEVAPIKEPTDLRGLFMVVFEDVAPLAEPNGAGHEPIPTNSDQRIADLERELSAKEQYLQITIEELETSNEELKSTNEELQSSNEELQSTNEELETSREELQSVNEELVTVNAELQIKLDALLQTSNDLSNLMSSTGIGTLFVDNDLRIARFTPSATDVINVIETDIGRPLAHLAPKLQYHGLVQDVRAVLDTLIPVEREVASSEERFYLMRIMPYRTLQNVIEGAVITFSDITEVKRLQALSRLAAIVRDSNDAITVQSMNGAIRAWNPGAERLYGWSEDEALSMSIQEIVPEERRAEALEFIGRLARGEDIPSFETQRVAKDGRVLDIWLAATQLVDESGQVYAIATTERDIEGTNRL
jgi:two-component system, chemotaxis family, CheB/CheR fusion protein